QQSKMRGFVAFSFPLEFFGDAIETEVHHLAGALWHSQHRPELGWIECGALSKEISHLALQRLFSKRAQIPGSRPVTPRNVLNLAERRPRKATALGSGENRCLR